jgi:GrpB-like predicted nucleotidyltransferase (UPF0157 family)
MTFRRYRIRTLMLTVAVVALFLSGPPTAWRWYTYRYRAHASAGASEMYLRMAARSERDAAALRDTLAKADHPKSRAALAGAEEEARGYRKLAAWADGMARKYREASSRPWQTVPGDRSYLATGNIRGEPEWSVTPPPKRH